MLRISKFTTSIVAMLLVVVMGCSTVWAGQATNIVAKDANNTEVTEENKDEVKEIRKTRVIRKGRCQAIADLQATINHKAQYYHGLETVSVDGIYGPKTRKAFIKLWQLEACEYMGSEVIAIDGIFGARSKELSKNFMLRPNNVKLPMHVRIVSAILIWYGYDHSFTYSYTPEFGSAVNRFQRDNGLAADGVVGPDTYYAIFNK